MTNSQPIEHPIEMGPIIRIHRIAESKLLSDHVSKTKTLEIDRGQAHAVNEMEPILQAATPEKTRGQLLIHSPKSVLIFPNETESIEKVEVDDDDSTSSTAAIASPPRSHKKLQKCINYTNQGCEAFESQQYDLAMHLFHDSHSLLHLEKKEDEVDLSLRSRVDMEFKSPNGYMDQRARVEFDEGMLTFSKTFKIHGNNEEIIDSTIWFNKGQVYMHHRLWEKAIYCFQSAIDVSGASELVYVYIAALQSMGQVQYRLGRYNEAITSYTKALNSATIIFGVEKHEAIAAALNSLSVLYYHLSSSSSRSGNSTHRSTEYLKQAKEHSKRSLSMRLMLQKEKLLDNADIGTTYNNIGRLYVMEGNFKKALVCYGKALKIRADCLGKDSLDYAATAFNAGQSYHHVRDLSKALNLYHEFLAVAMKRFTKNHRDIALVLIGIAEIHQQRGEMDEALIMYKKSLEAGKNALGENHPEIATMLNRLGNCYYINENYDAAYDVYSQGLAIERRLTNNANGVISLCNLGEIHRRRKEWDAAINIFKDALEIQRNRAGEGKQNAEIATSLHIIGMTYEKKGDPEGALRFLQEALIMRRFVLGENHIEVTSTLTMIGMIFLRTNKLSLAMDLLQQSLLIRERKLGKENRDVAFTLYNIALIHQKTGLLREAISCFTEVLRIERILLGENHKDIAITLFKLGETFKKNNDSEKALSYFKEALKVERMVMLETEPLTVARTLQEIGNINLEIGNIHEMMNAFIEAARIYEKLSMNFDNLIVTNRLYALALSYPRAAPAA
jgi:tetratricopeptide (TPR) repeat protein